MHNSENWIAIKPFAQTNIEQKVLITTNDILLGIPVSEFFK